MSIRKMAIICLFLATIPGGLTAEENDRVNGFQTKVVVKLDGEPRQGDKAPESEQAYTLHLNGTGLCEWGFFYIDLYKAALYLEETSRNAEKIIASKGAKRIHLIFSRSLTKEQLREAYTASLKVNAGDSFPRYEKRLEQLAKMLKDVEEGDSLVFTCIPKCGIEVSLKGKKAGTIKGEDFASMFFRLYLGDHPPTEDLKNALLGLEEE